MPIISGFVMPRLRLRSHDACISVCSLFDSTLVNSNGVTQSFTPCPFDILALFQQRRQSDPFHQTGTSRLSSTCHQSKMSICPRRRPLRRHPEWCPTSTTQSRYPTSQGASCMLLCLSWFYFWDYGFGVDGRRSKSLAGTIVSLPLLTLN